MTCWLPVLLLILHLSPGSTVTQTSSAPLVVTGVLGEMATLPLVPREKEFRSIVWLHNGVPIIIILSNEAQNPQISVADLTREHRLNVTESYSLQLSNLTKADSGSYCVRRVTKSSQMSYNYTLRIFERPSGLQVTSQVQWSVNGTCDVHLACSVKSPVHDITFRWQVFRDTPLREANLTVYWDPKNSSEQNYTCIAETPVGSVSSSVLLQSLCREAKKDTQLLDTMWLVYVALVLIFIITILCLLLIWKKKKGVFRLSTQQTQPPGEPPDSHYSPEPSGRSGAISELTGKTGSEAITPEVLEATSDCTFVPETTRNKLCTADGTGTTVYAQICCANKNMEPPEPVKNNDSFTIYSVIQQSAGNGIMPVTEQFQVPRNTRF